MKLHRRGFLHLGAGITALSTASRLARAQTYPTRPITMVVPNSPGTGTDAWTRIVVSRCQQRTSGGSSARPAGLKLQNARSHCCGARLS